jgi:hypothetical protein
MWSSLIASAALCTVDDRQLFTALSCARLALVNATCAPNPKGREAQPDVCAMVSTASISFS